MNRNTGTLAIAMAMLTGAAILQAASLETSVIDADGRRKAAEIRLAKVKALSSPVADQAKALYAEAAAKNNAWVDALCRAIDEGAQAAPDLSSLAEPASASLLAWVGAQDKALGNPETTAAIAEGSRKQVVQNLSDIATGSWKKNGKLAPEKRRQASADLRARLQWKSVEEVR